MSKFFLSRLLQTIPVALAVTVLVFLLMHAVPGDPISLVAGPNILQEDVSRVRAELGLDQSIPVQYVRWLSRAVRGDLGLSIRSRLPVSDEIVPRFINTLRLTAASLVITVLMGIPLGVLAALHRGSIWDMLTMGVALIGFSVPPFWLGLLLILVFAVHLGVLPAGGGDTNRHLILPAFSLGISTAALCARMTRSALLEVLQHDYLRTARAKGLTEARVIMGHALKNSLIPVVTVLTLQLGQLMGGAAVTEVVFAWPGIGSLMVSGILNRDFPIVQATLLVTSIFFVAVNLLADVIYAVLDPRIRIN